MTKIARTTTMMLAAISAVGLALITSSAEARRGDDDRRSNEGRRSDGGVRVNVDVNEQKMDVYVDGRLRHRWPVSTGRDGFDTPGGSYRVQRLEKEWYSKQYDGAPMPNAVFFHNGYAIHGTYETRRLGQQASHGCIRLHPRAAAALYDLVEDHGSSNTRIVIKND
jgi:lipoprotein-anchoring transpeptidase ErfK/SrfK